MIRPFKCADRAIRFRLIRCTCVVPSGDLTSKVKTSTATKSARER